MGYEVCILRKNNWEDEEEESNISLQEWLNYIQGDSELQLTSGDQLDLPVQLNLSEMENFVDQSEGYCEWIRHPRSDADTIPWFDYSYGTIITKYPDKHTVGKMIKIANALNAKVRGDDGEFYDESFFTNGGYPKEQ